MTVTASPRSASGSEFLQGLAAGLPETGFWSSVVLVAVSGGADSVALLVGLHELATARAAPVRLIVAHARHDLRPDAPIDAAFVEQLAAERQVPCEVRCLGGRFPIGARGEGIEARARRLRRAFFAELAREHGARFVVVAHTAEDQAETILHRGLRGTGVAGLAGMAVSRPLIAGVSLLRPLLSVSHEAARDYLSMRGQPWREDATNEHLRYARNFLRHEILPRCEAGPYPSARAALVRLGGQAAVIAGAVRSAAEHLLDLYAHRHGDGTVTLRTSRLAGLDRHLLAELFVALWEREGWPQRDMTARHYARLAEAAIASIEAAPSGTVSLPAGARVWSESDGMLRIARTSR